MKQVLESIRRHWAAVMVIWFTRIVLALVFVPTGLQKLLGIPFSRNLEPWAAFFFDALYAAGPYWRFLGLCEVAAGLLLLVPRFTLLGALMYAAIATNLLVITVSLRFLPDAIVSTSLMLLASLALVAWDWSRVKVLFSAGPVDASVRPTFRGSLVEAWRHHGFRIALAGTVLLLAGRACTRQNRILGCPFCRPGLGRFLGNPHHRRLRSGRPRCAFPSG